MTPSATSSSAPGDPGAARRSPSRTHLARLRTHTVPPREGSHRRCPAGCLGGVCHAGGRHRWRPEVTRAVEGSEGRRSALEGRSSASSGSTRSSARGGPACGCRPASQVRAQGGGRRRGRVWPRSASCHSASLERRRGDPPPADWRLGWSSQAVSVDPGSTDRQWRSKRPSGRLHALGRERFTEGDDAGHARFPGTAAVRWLPTR